MSGILAILTVMGCAAAPDKTECIAATIFAESDHSRECDMAVASVIYFAAGGRLCSGVTLADECLKPGRYCCWRAGSMTIPKDAASFDAWLNCKNLARAMEQGIFAPSIRADFFHDDRISAPPKEWGHVEKVNRIGKLTFYARK